MSIPVDLAELAEAVLAHDYAYLVTMTERATAHVVAVEPVVDGEVLRITGLGRRSVGNAAARTDVTLVWPPRVVGGHSLIVDGRAVTASGTTVLIAPSRAVLHRPTPHEEQVAAPEPGACVSDCVELSLTPGPS